MIVSIGLTSSFSKTEQGFEIIDTSGKGVTFQKAFGLEPSKSQYAHWLGRAFGRRAEMSNWFSAPGYASKARQYFEQAVALDPVNEEALNDLFDFYLQAPGFLGGGYDKAQAVARRIAL